MTVNRLANAGRTGWRFALALICFALCCGATEASAQEMEIVPGIPYARGGSISRSFDVVRPRTDETTAGVLLLLSEDLHSNWMPLANVEDRVRPLIDAGLTVFLIPHEPLVACSAEALVRRMRRAVKYIRRNAARFRVDPARLGAMGTGVSGHLALRLATSSGGDSTGDSADPKPVPSAAPIGNGLAAAVALHPVPLRPQPAQTEQSDGAPAGNGPDVGDNPIPAVLAEASGTTAILQIVARGRDSSDGWNAQSVQQKVRAAGMTSEVIKIDRGFSSGDADAELLKWFQTHLSVMPRGRSNDGEIRSSK